MTPARGKHAGLDVTGRPDLEREASGRIGSRPVNRRAKSSRRLTLPHATRLAMDPAGREESQPHGYLVVVLRLRRRRHGVGVFDG
jgi:hypothetical protein